MWNANIQDNTIRYNCSDTTNILNNGTNNVVSDNYTSKASWPSSCQDTINQAGIQSAYASARSIPINVPAATTGGVFPTPTPTPPPTAICGGVLNFNNFTFSSYGLNDNGTTQDAGSVVVQDGGATAYFSNNSWKSINLSYTVTANTVLTFDFRSTAEAEIHAIGFDTDNNNSNSTNNLFQLHGTQVFGTQTYKG